MADHMAPSASDIPFHPQLVELEVPLPHHLDNSHISIDFFVSKDNIGGGGGLRFTDASNGIVFQDQKLPSRGSNSKHRRILNDAAGNPLIRLHREKDGCWKGYKANGTGSGSEENEMIFKVWKTVDLLHQNEFQVSIIGENGSGSGSESDFKMRGSQFYRSFNMYYQNSVVAQSSLMHKLGIRKHLIIPRSKFRLTIFPGFKDQAPLIVAFTVIFFHDRKLWI